jgi:hypothetical protein
MAEPKPLDERLAPLTEEEVAVIVKVVETLRRIKYGTVVIAIQDGKVVQIELAEKFRLR